MSDARIHEVKRIMELEGNIIEFINGDEWGVNEYLAEGWILLQVLVGRESGDLGSEQYPKYILGWTGEDDPPSDRAKEESAEAGRQAMERFRNLNWQGP